MTMWLKKSAGANSRPGLGFSAAPVSSRRFIRLCLSSYPLGIIRAFDFMNTRTRQNQIPKVITLILVSIGAAWLMMGSDASTLAKLDTMSPADYIQHQRELHHHSFMYHFVLL